MADPAVATDHCVPVELRTPRPAGKRFLTRRIVLTDGTTPRAAFDAKYKLENADADIYQALAYAKALDLDRVILVYPDDGEVTPRTHQIRHDGTEILVRTIPIGVAADDFSRLDAEASARVLALIQEAVGTHGASVAA